MTSADFLPFSTKTFYGNTNPQNQRSLEAAKKKSEASVQFPKEFIPRILGPTVCWKTFYRQTDAFEFAQSTAEDIHVFAYESCSDPTIPGTGQRRYLAASRPVFWHYYSQLQACQKQHYEIIPEGAPCKLYFDLEFQTVSNPKRDGNQMVNIFIKYVCAWLFHVYAICCDRKNVLDLDASTSSKVSRHLIFQGSDLIFENNVSQGNFVRYILGVLRGWTHTYEKVSEFHPSCTSSSDDFSVCPSQKVKSPKQGQTSTEWNDSCISPVCLPNVNQRLTATQEELQSTRGKSSVSLINSESSVTHSLCEYWDDIEFDDYLCANSDRLLVECVGPNEKEMEYDHQTMNSQNDTVSSFPCPNELFDERNDHMSPHNTERTLEMQKEISEIERAVLSSFCRDELNDLFVAKKDGEETFFCDVGVYTKNRNFRLYQSSKLNKNNPLRVAKDNEFITTNTTSADEEQNIFYTSLVTNVSVCEKTQMLRYDNITGSDKVAGTVRRRSRRKQDVTGGSFLSYEDKAGLEGLGCTSPYSEIDQYIDTLVSCQGRNGCVRRWNYWVHSQTLVYDIAGYRWCHNIRRQHKSNNIMYVVDVGTGVFYQKCHDPECQTVNFRSPEMQLPHHILPGYFLELDNLSETPHCQEVMDYTIHTEEEKSEDEILLTAVDDVEFLQTVGELDV